MKLREIERLRGVAIVMVMLVHWGFLRPFRPGWLDESWTGVDLFFVISGYVVTLSLLRLLPPLDDEPSFAAAFAKATGAIKRFYARRFFRIVPAVLALFLLDRVLLTFFPIQLGSASDWWREFLAFFGGVYNYGLAYRGTWLGVLWSLSVEEHFYLFVPLLFVALRTTDRRLLGCGVIILACILLRHLGHPDGVDVLAYEKFSSHLRFDSLMAGVALALLATTARLASPRPATTALWPKPLLRFVLLPAVVVVLAAMAWSVDNRAMMREGFVAAWALSALLVGFAGLDRGYVLSFPVLAPALEFLGARSYALYLVHQTCQRVVTGLKAEWPLLERFFARDDEYPWRFTLATVAVTFLVTELVHRLVERPFLRLGRKLTDPAREAPSPVPRRIWIPAAAAAGLLTVVYFRHGLELALWPRNLAAGKRVIASSQWAGRPPPSALTNGVLEPEFGLHTEREKDPWAVIDLGAPARIGAVRVYARADGYEDEPLPLALELSMDGKRYAPVAWQDRVFSQSWPWRVRLPGRMARYVRLRVMRASVLCLSEVEVFASDGPASWP